MHKKIPSVVFLTVALCGLVPVLYFSNKYLAKQSLVQQNQLSECKNKTPIHYLVVIKDDKVSPTDTTGHICDSLTITNKDSKTREIAFGHHDNHVSYDGITEKALAKDEILTITLNKTGSYLFHDHDQEEVAGTFTVLP